MKPFAEGTFNITDDTRYAIGQQPAIEMVSRLASEAVAVDIETAGVGELAMQVKIVVISNENESALLDPRDPVQAKVIRRVLHDAPELDFHNAPFDVPILVRKGLMSLADIAKVIDTLTYCRMAEPDERTRKNLESAVERYLGTGGSRRVGALVDVFRAQGMTKKEGFRQFDIDRPAYCMNAALDGIMTKRLVKPAWQAAFNRIVNNPYVDSKYRMFTVGPSEAADLIEREQRINRISLHRNSRGLRTDLEFLDQYRETVRKQRYADEAQLDSAGIKPGNGRSLTAVLEAEGALPDDYPRTPTGLYKADERTLKKLAHPLAKVFLRHKQTVKVDKDYLDKVVALADEQDRVYPSTNVLGAATGRASMADPPLHQFPPEARGIILADEGDELTSIDWAQIEPCLAANIARDYKIIEAYEAGADFYEGVSAAAGGIPRKKAKVALLAQLYGEGFAALARDLGLTEEDAFQQRGEESYRDSEEELALMFVRHGYSCDGCGRQVTFGTGVLAGRDRLICQVCAVAKSLRDDVLAPMPRVERMITALRKLARYEGIIFTMSGRMIPIPWGVYNGERSRQAHKGVNYFVQGSAYDLLADVLIRIEDEGLSEAVYLTVHDELVVSTSAADDIRRIMQTPPDRLCRLSGRQPLLRTDRADLGERWSKPE